MPYSTVRVYFVIDGEDSGSYGPFVMVEHIHGELVGWKHHSLKNDKRFVLAMYDLRKENWILGPDVREEDRGARAEYYQVWPEFEHE